MQKTGFVLGQSEGERVRDVVGQAHDTATPTDQVSEASLLEALPELQEAFAKLVTLCRKRVTGECAPDEFDAGVEDLTAALAKLRERQHEP